VSARAGGARTRLALLPVAPFDGEGRAVVPELRLVPPAGSEEATARRVDESAGDALPGDVATTQQAPAKRHRADLSTSPVSRARSADATDRQPSPRGRHSRLAALPARHRPDFDVGDVDRPCRAGDQVQADACVMSGVIALPVVAGSVIRFTKRFHLVVTWQTDSAWGAPGRRRPRPAFRRIQTVHSRVPSPL